LGADALEETGDLAGQPLGLQPQLEHRVRLHQPRVRDLLCEVLGIAEGGDQVVLVTDDEHGYGDGVPLVDLARDGPRSNPCSTAAMASGSIDNVPRTLSSASLPVRGRRRRIDAVHPKSRRPKLTASNNGTNKLAAAGVAHSRTGISTSNAATRSGACTATCSETFAPRDTPPTTARSTPSSSSRATTWRAERSIPCCVAWGGLSLLP